MYLKSVTVSPKGKEIEFSYPKIISKNEIEYTGMYIKGIDSKNYICDKQGRISLRNSMFKTKDGRSFVVKPIASRTKGEKNNNENYVFYIKIFEKLKDEIKLVTTVNCQISEECKNMIHDTFIKSLEEVKQKINSLENMDLLFWSGGYEDFDEKLFNESVFCYPAEIFNNKGKEYWEVESFIDTDYLESLLENVINKKYGFSNMFKMLDYGLHHVVESSKFNIDIDKIMKTMHQINDGFYSFKLGSIILQK